MKSSNINFKKFVTPLCTPNQLLSALKNYISGRVRRDDEYCDHRIDLMWRWLDDKYNKKQSLFDCMISDKERLLQCNNTQEQLLEMLNTIEAVGNNLTA